MTKSTTKTKETAVTQPNVPNYALEPVQNYYGGLGGIQDMDPSQFVTPANQLQQSAYDKARNLNTAGGYDYARGLLARAETSATNATPIKPTFSAMPGNLDVANVNRVAAPEVAQAGVGYLGPASTATDTSGLSDKEVAQYGGASAYGSIDKYLDPQLDSYVKAALANFDDTAGRQQAAYAAQGAGNKAFGGSRYGIGEAQLLSDQTRGRALTDAELRSDAYKTALEAAQGDANRANSAGIASMQAKNARDELLGSLSTQLGMFNSGQQNEFSQSMFDAVNNAMRFNATETNDILSQAFGAETAAALQDAAAQNSANSQMYSTEANNNQFNAEAANRAAEFNNNAQLNQSRAYTDIAGAYGQNVGNKANAQRADIGLQTDIGNNLWTYENMQNLAPLIKQQAIADLLSPGLLSAISGQTINSTGTTTGGNGLLQSLIAAGAKVGSAAAASERRVKRDIVLLGREADGLGIYRYNYVWDDPEALPRFGVMVDEVEQVRPWALGPVVDGIQTVNYGEL